MLISCRRSRAGLHHFTGLGSSSMVSPGLKTGGWGSVPPALQSSYLWLLYDDDARSELRAEVSVSDDDKTPELESDDSQTESPRAIARAERKG